MSVFWVMASICRMVVWMRFRLPQKLKVFGPLKPFKRNWAFIKL